MNKATAFLKAHWPVIVAFAGAAWAQFGTQIETWAAHNPHLAGWVAFAAFTMSWLRAYYMTPPQKPAAQPPVNPPA